MKKTIRTEKDCINILRSNTYDSKDEIEEVIATFPKELGIWYARVSRDEYNDYYYEVQHNGYIYELGECKSDYEKMESDDEDEEDYLNSYYGI